MPDEIQPRADAPPAAKAKAKRARKTKPTALPLSAPLDDDGVERIWEELGELRETVEQQGEMIVELAAKVALLAKRQKDKT